MIKMIRSKISGAEVRGFLGKPYTEMIKFVADLNQGILAMGGEFHADGEAVLLAEGSQQSDLWGGNYYPALKKIEYTSLINIRPSMENLSMELQEESRRKKMEQVVRELLE